MNWIIRSIKTVKFHSNLNEVLKPIFQDLVDYNWILTDLDFISETKIPINFSNDYFYLNNKEFEEIYQSDVQIIWGVISAVPKNSKIDFSFVSKISAEDDLVWRSNQFQIKESVIEIIAFDSSYTIIKFKDEILSEKFKNYFQSQALDLTEFNNKYNKN